MKDPMQRKHAFTLIELLIVVAIIAILAAIAVPNFLEAQTRAKISRAKADMRTVAMGLEAYHIDANCYPLCNNYSLCGRRVADPQDSSYWVLENLSTPIAYLTTGFVNDPFPSDFRTNGINSTTGLWTPVTRIGDPNDFLYGYYKYNVTGIANGFGGLMDVDGAHPSGTKEPDRATGWYMLSSAGPVRTYYNIGGLLSTNATEEACARNFYDPSNGTISTGLICRVGGTALGEGDQYGDRFFNTYQKTGGLH
jgi:prepilin-type N-terminal cleavage/methylation domain-containing protein